MKAEVKGNVITLEGTADEVAQALKLLGYAVATLAPKYVERANIPWYTQYMTQMEQFQTPQGLTLKHNANPLELRIDCTTAPVDAPKNTSYTYALPLEEWSLPQKLGG